MNKSLKFATMAALAALFLPTSFASADSNHRDGWRVAKAVKLKGLKKHLSELQLIATRNAGTRAAGTPGHDASAAYVAAQLKKVGYKVEMLPFDFSVFAEVSPPSFAQTAPGAVTYVEGTDFLTLEYSGSGQTTAEVQGVAGTVLPPTPDPSSISGCDPADFAGFVAGRVALIQRGGCTFALKATNAHAAGASAAIIFNEGNANDPSRVGLFGGTLGEDFAAPIPVIGVPFAVGETLSGLAGAIVSVKTDTKTEVKSTVNVVAESKSERAGNVIVVGAHLDSVQEGAGIQDNGSGSAAILEVARQLRKQKIKPRNTVRFMWYSAEEAGLVGSQNYVDSLSDVELGKIALMLNFDMVASPNFVRFVYDGDGSDTGGAGPDGSAEIEQVFAKFFNSRKLPFEATAFDGRSDYGPFIDIGIPAGGLFTGAEDVKTPDQAVTYGGTAGVAFDACYHQACDDINNINDQVFDEMADAVARVVTHFAMAKTPLTLPPPAPVARVAKAATKARLYKGPHLVQ